MGYYTNFELTWSGSGAAFERFEKEGADESFTDWEMTPRELSDSDDMKWYSYGDDMLALPAKWPTVLFELHGEGEESGDIWIAWYRNGKGIRVDAEVVITKPDLNAVIPPIDAAAIDAAERERQRVALQQEIDALQTRIEALE